MDATHAKPEITIEQLEELLQASFQHHHIGPGCPVCRDRKIYSMLCLYMKLYPHLP